MWADFLKNTVLRPGLERLGTVAAIWLVTGGEWMCRNWDACGLVTDDGARMVVAYVIGAAFVAFDLAVIHLNRKKGRR